MDEQPTPETIDRWHRWFAAECNNRAWDLASRASRSPAEDQELLHAAFASAFHWSRLGRPLNDARADVTVAHALSTLGRGREAMPYAQRSLAYFEAGQGEDWDLAFAHLEVAFAAAASGDAALRARHQARAAELAAAIQDPDDRQVVLDELARLSAVG